MSQDPTRDAMRRHLALTYRRAMTTTTSTRTHVPTRNHALTAARVVAGLLGSSQLAGIVYFVLVAPEEGVWVGPWLDIPVVALMVAGSLLKVALAVIPSLPQGRRITMGLVAVAIGIGVTLVKIPVYDEPEGVLFLAFESVLLGILLLARRATNATR